MSSLNSILNSLLLFFIIVATLSCHNQKKGVADESNAPANKGEDVTLIDSLMITRQLEESNEITIEGAIIQSDSLLLSVAYSGGCELHEFKLLSSGVMAKSLPPQLQLTLIHNNNGDLCRNLIRKTLRFSLLPINNIYNNKIILRIDHLKQPLIYVPN